MIRNLKQLIILPSLLSLIALAGCSSEIRSGGESVPDLLESATGETSLRFVLSMPGGEAVSFTRAAIQTKSEYLIEQLDVYQFAGATGEEVLERTYLNQAYAKVGDGASLTLKVKGTGNKTFVFVANNKGNGVVRDIEAPAVGMKLSEFERTMTESTEGTLLSSPLLMLGSKTLEVKEGMSGQKVELQRVMARLDIKNYEPFLTLKRVRLERVNDRGSLAVDGIASGAKVIDLPEVLLPTAPTAAGEDPAVALEAVADKVTAGGVVSEPAHLHYKHVYYPYAGNEVADEKGASVLIIEGTLFKGDPEREHDVLYKKVLKLDGANQYLGFKRNHRYTVAIKGGNIPGEADIKLYVNEWNLVELPIEEVEPMAPRADYFIGEFHGRRDDFMSHFSEANQELILIGNSPNYKVNGLDVLLRVDANVDWNVVHNKQVITDKANLNDWLSVELVTTKPDVDSKGVPLFDSSFNNAIKFDFLKPNLTGKDRSVELYLVTKFNPSLKTKFTVLQSAKANKL